MGSAPFRPRHHLAAVPPAAKTETTTNRADIRLSQRPEMLALSSPHPHAGRNSLHLVDVEKANGR